MKVSKQVTNKVHKGSTPFKSGAKIKAKSTIRAKRVKKI